MKAKLRAKHGMQLIAAVSLAALLASMAAHGDDGYLPQQLRTQQQKSRFQLMLQQVQESARRRAASRQSVSEPPADKSPAAEIGNSSESMRLDPVSVADPPSLNMDPEGAQEFQSRQAYDRDQQRILEYRQQRRALIVESGPDGPLGANSYAQSRNELVRSNKQNQQQTLQRKLRN